MLERLNYIREVSDNQSKLPVVKLDTSQPSNAKRQLTEEEERERKRKNAEKQRRLYYIDKERKDEERRIRQRKRYANLTPEERKAECKRKNDNNRKRLMRLKERDIEKYNEYVERRKAKKRANYHKKKANVTDEQRERHRISARKSHIRRMILETEEQKKVRLQKDKERRERRLARMTPAELEAYKENKRRIGRESAKRCREKKKLKLKYYVVV